MSIRLAGLLFGTRKSPLKASCVRNGRRPIPPVGIHRPIGSRSDDHQLGRLIGRSGSH
jgi:hypothetical protein